MPKYITKPYLFNVAMSVITCLIFFQVPVSLVRCDGIIFSTGLTFTYTPEPGPRQRCREVDRIIRGHASSSPDSTSHYSLMEDAINRTAHWYLSLTLAHASSGFGGQRPRTQLILSMYEQNMAAVHWQKPDLCDPDSVTPTKALIGWGGVWLTGIAYGTFNAVEVKAK